MSSPESKNQSAQFLKEHRQVLTMEVFEHAATDYRIYLDKVINRRNALLAEELTEKTFRQLKAMEEQLKVMLGFYGIVDMTVKILSEEAIKSLNFDAREWGRYKMMEQENAMLMAFIDKKLKQQGGKGT
jgi:hypothetical protein